MRCIGAPAQEPGADEARRDNRPAEVMVQGAAVAVRPQQAQAREETDADEADDFKPLDAAVHEFFGKASSVVATLEDHVAMGGYGSAVLECLNAAGVRVPVVMLAWPDVFVEHASSVDELRKRHGMTVPALVSRVLEQLEQQEARQDVEIRSRGVAVAG